MAKLIRCVEGHVFDPATGKCPECGWSVDQPQQDEADAATPGSRSLALPFALGVGGTAVVAAILYAIFIHPPAPPKPNTTIAVPAAPNAPQASTAAAPGARIAAPTASTPPAKGLVAPTLSEPDKWPIGSNAIVMRIRKISKDVFERRQRPEFCPDGWSRSGAFEHRGLTPIFVTQDRSDYYDVCVRTTRLLGNLKYLGLAGMLGNAPRLLPQTSDAPVVDTPLMIELVSIRHLLAGVANHRCMGLFETSEDQCLDVIRLAEAAPFVVVRASRDGSCAPGEEPLLKKQICLSWPNALEKENWFNEYAAADKLAERLRESGEERLLIVQNRNSQEGFSALRPFNEKARETGECKQGTVFESFRYCLIEP